MAVRQERIVPQHVRRRGQCRSTPRLQGRALDLRPRGGVLTIESIRYPGFADPKPLSRELIGTGPSWVDVRWFPKLVRPSTERPGESAAKDCDDVAGLHLSRMSQQRKKVP